jgi:hypothetical protein
MKKGRAQEVRGYKIDEIEARPEDHMIAHDKRPGNTNGLQKGPRPRKMLAKGRDPVGPRPGRCLPHLSA